MNTEQTAQEITTRQVPVTIIYDKNVRATKPVVLNEGGADSSKSHSIAQLFVQKYKNEYNKVFLVTRKTLPSLKLSAYKLILELLKDYGHYRYLKHNKSERTLYYHAHNNLMIFLSIDDPEKIKSIDFNYIWMEEAGEFTWDDFINLRKCNRAKTKQGEPNRTYLSLNPIDELGWINKRLKKQSDVEVIHSTYKDNPFAQTADIDVLEGLKDQDDSYYRIYTLGLYAKLKGKIHDIEIASKYPDGLEIIYGLDFGFINPSVLIKYEIDIEKMAVYMTELIYETHLTNSDLIDRMKEEVPKEGRRKDIYADSAEPDRIEEIYQAGFNVKPCKKGKGSVVNGINFLNRFKLYSREENVNTNREYRGYKRKVDKNGEVLEDPVEYNDHCPTTGRYAVYTHLWERFVGEEPGEVFHQGIGKPKMGPKDRPETPEKADIRERLAPDASKVTRGDKPKKEEESKSKKEEIIEDDDVGFVV